MGRRLPVGKPTPFAADDVHERISYRTKASTQITSELLGPESRDRLQNPVVGPTVVRVEQLNVILSHGERVPAFCLATPIPDQRWVKWNAAFLATWIIGPSDGLTLSNPAKWKACGESAVISRSERFIVFLITPNSLQRICAKAGFLSQNGGNVATVDRTQGMEVLWCPTKGSSWP